MSDVISEYQKWKQQGGDLRVKAKQAMESRFRELLTEAVRIAEEYRADFGSALKPPPTISVFRYKAHAKARTKKVTAPKAQRPSDPPPTPVAEKVNPKVAALQKRLAIARRKLESARTAGKNTKTFEDRVYEIEDELRLANQAS